MRRRHLLAGSAALLLPAPGRALTVRGELPWRPNAAGPPHPVDPAGLIYLAPEEADALGVLADRIIPPDALSPGGRDMGCVVFIDRQLAGPYGRAAGLYLNPPFADPLPTNPPPTDPPSTDPPSTQGGQSPLTPAARYRQGLAALAEHVRLAFAGRRLRDLDGGQVDAILSGMEHGTLTLPGTDARAFAATVIRDVKHGFFADPVHGGNRNMAAWTMLGFPGTRYDHRDWIDRHNQPCTLPPTSLAGRPAWTEGR